MPFTLVLALLLLSFIKGGENESAFTSPLIKGVFHVLGVRAEPQVFWIYALWIVASVTDAFTLRKGAFEFLEDKTMSQVVSPLAILSPSDLAIPRAQLLTRVIPAFRFKIYLNPQ